MSAIFNESDHPREGDGKFAAKDSPESEASMGDEVGSEAAELSELSDLVAALKGDGSDEDLQQLMRINSLAMDRGGAVDMNDPEVTGAVTGDTATDLATLASTVRWDDEVSAARAAALCRSLSSRDEPDTRAALLQALDDDEPISLDPEESGINLDQVWSTEVYVDPDTGLTRADTHADLEDQLSQALHEAGVIDGPDGTDEDDERVRAETEAWVGDHLDAVAPYVTERWGLEPWGGASDLTFGHTSSSLAGQGEALRMERDAFDRYYDEAVDGLADLFRTID